ncbi:MAG: peptide deformylase [Methylococcales bacterium]|nr:peptide deformylase [Methylococcales bacterium]
MSILTILEFPDKRLRTKAKEITVFDGKVKTLVNNMLETMYDYKGVGLAATQVNVHQRVIVIDVSEDKNEHLCLINPLIIEKDGEEETEEGCLSVPGFFEMVYRAEHIKVKAMDKDGKPFEIEAKGLLSVCIQHEMDHLDGKLFVDYLSSFKRKRIKTKLDKIHKQEGKNTK